RANIHAAALAGDVDAVRALLAAGASPNATLPVGDDPALLPVPVLYLACVLGHAEVAAVLLEAGANPNDGESVYHAAEHDHRACLALLAAHGADLSARHPHWDNTPLYFLAGYPPDHPRADTVARGMAWLLAHGADPAVASHVRTADDGTPGVAEQPLHRLAANGWDGDRARELVAHGAPVDAPRGDGRTALALAVRDGNVAMADTLRALGADVARVSAVDRLIGAAMTGDADAVAQLRTAHPEVEPFLAAPRATADHHALLRACQLDREAGVRLLVALGWSLRQEGPWGGTALHWAAWHGRPRIVGALLALGAPVDQRDSQYGSSPIAWGAHGSAFGRAAADADYVAVIRLLAAAGASRAPSFNRWNESPESMAAPAVAEALRAWAAAAP
ncbi:MAG: ankyrin repeat domain-containing protein, partial [Gemmatimonadetes bacterium]|nr:ankyrin repeat domain-containing protein [Gemmatimonadota bacterium]